MQLLHTAVAKQLWPHAQSPLPEQSPLFELPDEPDEPPVLHEVTSAPVKHFGFTSEALQVETFVALLLQVVP